MSEQVYRVDNGAGWDLDLRRFVDPEVVEIRRRPVLMVPGYCMNCHILNYHPTELALIQYLVAQGFEVWAANLRGQGASRRRWGPKRYGFKDLALTDLPTAIAHALAHTKSTAGAVDLVGCSLGATVSYVYLAHHQEDHQVGALVNIGGPLRWNRTHPLIEWAAKAPGLYRWLPIRGTRKMARLAVPLARRVPGLLSLYLNPERSDLSNADKLVQTIDDPDPKLTAQIAQWVKARDLVVAGLNISDALHSVAVPIMCVVAMQDGVVTPEAALSVLDHIGSDEIEIVEVGSADEPHAHADLFISRGVGQKVFEPVARWLAAMGS